MPMPAAFAWRATVSTSQRSSGVRGSTITWAPVERLAIHLDSASEMNEPVKPTTVARISKPTVLRGSMPNAGPMRLVTRPSMTSTARLVPRNNMTRDIAKLL